MVQWRRFLGNVDVSNIRKEYTAAVPRIRAWFTELVKKQCNGSGQFLETATLSQVIKGYHAVMHSVQKIGQKMGQTRLGGTLLEFKRLFSRNKSWMVWAKQESRSGEAGQRSFTLSVGGSVDAISAFIASLVSRKLFFVSFPELTSGMAGLLRWRQTNRLRAEQQNTENQSNNGTINHSNH